MFMRHVSAPWVMLIGFAGVLYTMYAWWSDVIKEGQVGDHTPVVRMHHRYGMMLFIASEIMFFVAWFWAYFDQFFRHGDAEQYARVEAMGTAWPPTGVELFDPFHLPLFNTLLLLTSGTTVTWAHHALIHGDRKGLKAGLALTIALGAAVHLRAGDRIFARRLLLFGQHLRRHLLHGDGLPRLPRDHRHDLPDREPGPRPGRPAHRRAITSASSLPPGTGTSSTWSGCSCLPRSTSGAAGACRSRTASPKANRL